MKNKNPYKAGIVAGLVTAALSCSSSSSNITDPGADAAGGAGGAGGSDAGGPGEGGGAGPTAAQACAELASAECEKVNECNPWYLQKYFGDIDTCKMRYTSTACSAYLGLTSSSATPATFQACATATKGATCQQWLDGDAVLNSCLTEPGMLASGATCGTASQCQTANCNFPAGATCGTCGPQSGAGAQCSSDSLWSGNFLCVNGLCGTPGEAGAACSSTALCANSLACANGRCAIPAKAGEACSSALPCDGHLGLFCRNSVCQNIQYVSKGQPCNPSQGRECAQSGFCKGATSTADGTCLAFAADGAACDASAGPICMPYARCTGGFCKVSDPSLCR
jgi:hypothetical protein